MDLNLSNDSFNIKKNNGFRDELENYLEKSYTLFSVDRFEGDFAICENKSTGKFVNIEKSLLPENVKEGDILKFENNTYTLENSETKKEQEEIKNMVINLFKKKS